MKQISVRELQHNLSKYLEIVRIHPLMVTKHGKQEALLINPEKYTVKAKPRKTKNIMQSLFIGMHKGRTDWKEKSSEEIARNLREKAWYGKKEYAR